MVHGPCGNLYQNSPCMKDGECTKKFPKPLQQKTVANNKGYPLYRRRNASRINVNGKEIDNTWIVPYNPYLLLKYNCHINVEVCATIKSVKYLFKYVYKGHDCANVRITEQNVNYDEVQKHVDSRYVSAPEAMWRIFGYEMHDQSHTVIRLPVHLPDQHNVVFNSGQLSNDEAFIQRAQRDTMLTAWFKLNQQCQDAQGILYTDIPKLFVFDQKARTWKPRQRGEKNVIGRMYSVNLGSDPERYCFRLLLLHRPGATSFEYLRTSNGILYPSFKEAAMHFGLITNDEIWEKCLHEAVVCSMPHALRDLFAYILIFASPSNANELFTKFKNHFMEDFAHKHTVGHTENCEQCINFALIEINNVLMSNHSSCDKYNLPMPSPNFTLNTNNNVDYVAIKHLADEMITNFNEEQKRAFDLVISAIDNNNHSSRCFFLDGPGGTGKTYFYKTLLNYIRGNGGIALPVASTGIAANLLEGGKTYFNLFKITPPLTEITSSNIRMNSPDADFIRSAKVIIWDEATMAPGIALTVVDKLLKEVMKNQKPFGGKVFLLGGDFRQTLPVVRRGGRTKIIESCIKFHKLWKHFKILKLNKNVRSLDQQFSDWLISVGNGEHTIDTTLPDEILEIPSQVIYSGDDIAQEIFGSSINTQDPSTYSTKVILCPKNSDVDNINTNVLNLVEGESICYLSTDSIDPDGSDSSQDNSLYPIEFLNEQTPTGMPLHRLTLKVGAIIMLLRNLNTMRGLCNGTRLIVTQLKPNLIIGKVFTGSSSGQIVFIPRIELAPTDVDLPFVLRRRQFPVKLAFGMTINKSQGQTLDEVGIFLREPVFSHGQLYVALSRARTFGNLKIKIVDGQSQGKLKNNQKVYTKNIVYKEVLSE